MEGIYPTVYTVAQYWHSHSHLGNSLYQLCFEIPDISCLAGGEAINTVGLLRDGIGRENIFNMFRHGPETEFHFRFIFTSIWCSRSRLFQVKYWVHHLSFYMYTFGLFLSFGRIHKQLHDVRMDLRLCAKRSYKSLQTVIQWFVCFVKAILTCNNQHFTDIGKSPSICAKELTEVSCTTCMYKCENIWPEYCVGKRHAGKHETRLFSKLKLLHSYRHKNTKHKQALITFNQTTTAYFKCIKSGVHEVIIIRCIFFFYQRRLAVQIFFVG